MNIMGENKMTADQVIETLTQIPTREQVVKNERATNHVWKPISHSSAVENIMGAFEKHDITVVDSSFALNRTGQTIVGGFRVQGDILPAMPDNLDGMYEMFFRHANDMSISMQLNAGMSLFVCTNGVMTGERIASRKHTVNFDFSKWIVDEGVPSFITACGSMGEKVDLLKGISVNNRMAFETILEAGDRGIIPMADTVKVYREWKNPTFNAGDFEPYTGWKLYNDFTYVAQKNSAHRQHQIIGEAYELVAELAN